MARPCERVNVANRAFAELNSDSTKNLPAKAVTGFELRSNYSPRKDVPRKTTPRNFILLFPAFELFHVSDNPRAIFFKIPEHHNQAYASRDSKCPPGPNLADSLLSMPYHG